MNKYIIYYIFILLIYNYNNLCHGDYLIAKLNDGTYANHIITLNDPTVADVPVKKKKSKSDPPPVTEPNQPADKDPSPYFRPFPEQPPPFLPGRPSLFPPAPPFPPPLSPVYNNKKHSSKGKPNSITAQTKNVLSNQNNTNNNSTNNQISPPPVTASSKPKPKASKAKAKASKTKAKGKTIKKKKKIKNPSGIVRTPIPIIPCGCEKKCTNDCCCDESPCPSPCPPPKPCSCANPFPVNDCEVPDTSVMTIQQVSHLYSTCHTTASRSKILKALGQMVLDARNQHCENCGFLQPKAPVHHQCSCACPQDTSFPSASDHYDVGAPLDCCLKQCGNSQNTVQLNGAILAKPPALNKQGTKRKQKRQFVLNLHAPGTWELGSRRPDPYPTYPRINPSAKELPDLQRLALKTVEQMKMYNAVHKKPSKKEMSKTKQLYDASEQATDIREHLQARSKAIHQQIEDMQGEIQQLQHSKL